jgi:hypothetical protein
MLLQKLNIALPYDPMTPLLGIYQKELKLGSVRNISTPMLMSVPLTIVKIENDLEAHRQMNG